MRKVVLVAFVLSAITLAGCVGGGSSSDTGTTTSPDNGASDTNVSDGGGSGGSGTDDGDSGDGAGSGSGSGSDGDDGPRTPDDAVPGLEPADTGEGMAHYQFTSTSDFAFNGFFSLVLEMGPCQDDLTPAPVGESCADFFNFTVKRDIKLVEVAVTWESDRTDLNVVIHNENGKDIDNSGHGQVFINQFCNNPVISECIFIFPPNGTTWEYLFLNPTELEDGGPGTWTIEIQDRNNWRTEHAGTMTGGEGPEYTIDMWFYTVNAMPSNHPEKSG